MKKIILLLALLVLPLVTHAEKNTPPRIYLIGGQTISFDQGSNFVDPGYRALDDQDPAQKLVHSFSTSGINMNVIGTYLIRYRVTDTGGLFTEAVRNVVVNHPPIGPAKLRFALSSNDSGENVVPVDDTSNTNGVHLLHFTVSETEGNSAVTVNSLEVKLDGSAPVSDITNNLNLIVDGNEVGSSHMVSGGLSHTVLFSDLGVVISASSTKEFVLTADVNDLSLGVFSNGDTLRASLTPLEISHVVAHKENGVALGSSDLIGSVLGSNKAFYSSGIIPQLVSTNVLITPGGPGVPDVGVFELRFNATAFGDDEYLDRNCDYDNDGVFSVGTNSFSFANNQNLTFLSCVIESNSDLGANSYQIQEGNTERFTLRGYVSPTVSTNTRMTLESLSYADADVSGTKRFTFGLGANSIFRTDSVFLNAN